VESCAAEGSGLSCRVFPGLSPAAARIVGQLHPGIAAADFAAAGPFFRRGGRGAPCGEPDVGPLGGAGDSPARVTAYARHCGPAEMRAAAAAHAPSILFNHESRPGYRA